MGRGELVVVLGIVVLAINHGRGRYGFGAKGGSSGSGLTADSSVLTLTLAFLDFGLDFAQSFPFHAQFCHFGLAKVDVDYQLAQRLQAKEQKQFTNEQKATFHEIIPDEEEVAIDAIPLATKPPTIVDWKIHKEGKKNYYQIIRADGSSKMYLVFSHMLKSFDREDFETLWKLTMFEPHVEDRVWRNQQDYRVLDWKLYDSYGVHSLRMQHMHIHMLVEKRYPLTPATITDMLNKKLQERIVGIKSLLNAALIDVSAAQSKLVLLENFNENYSKCLRLLVKLQLPVQSYYC
ncbi:hypothetical protein Tco_1457262 [Tanacetum coccineum]